MIGLLIGLCGIYFVIMIIMIISWYSIPLSKHSTGHLRSVSVIIPMRNEEHNITDLLYDLVSQNYPEEKLQVILVDDHSSDRSVAIAQSALKKYQSTFAVIGLEEGEYGKKAALTEGISMANGEVILTTDADCRVNSTWIQTMVSAFDSSTKMAFGPVQLIATSFFGKLQMIDFSALIGVGAASWRLGTPGMCNGANLAFTKEVFKECNGYQGTEQYPSGDDEFLMRKIKNLYPNSIKFVKDTSAVVSTKPMHMIRSFIQQRIRWAGKWKLHQDMKTGFTAVFIFLFYIILLTVTIVEFVNTRNMVLISTLWIIKWLLDAILVASVLRLSRIQLPVFHSIMLSFIYPFYAIVIGLSTISYNFEWKGRKY